ncbi:MAG: Segregation and condensation protein B [Candidatus Moranbacteria bacterium GW2011_GWE2_35_2-]|nr:MAG: Segregation and condensation protein B [Candidatus Moranbacteria bacterium GW2011_GWE2_35_2-]KKQ04312.1 MAG: Segregation and condensation protein B [Candidatus Moranbacteria bacterium GW2011_GWF1_36_4]KKQ21810.1 MAG: Segregation and condensation protein B [Candidatus Moranbacteria bacterium GW2011_GWF2_37_11]KKQ28875.1 MAG: Segregation and condensation protein B [Candidatus Moranbacteria bacterium GW2011_GWD1_37_17]KKQ31048.1 MAG: Segregation and condensation protein B [Candidatus Moran
MNLKSIIESILFVSGEPLAVSKICKITKQEKEKIENVLVELVKEYSEEKRGIGIIRKEESVQMVSNPENSEFVEGLVKSELQESLGKAALEVLSVIAYRGPIARFGIEEIRGVNSSFILRNLLMRGLVERISNPKDSRGYLYKISFDFIKKLGIADISELPDFEKLSKDERADLIVENLEKE